jgi:hypothetical protein
MTDTDWTDEEVAEAIKELTVTLCGRRQAACHCECGKKARYWTNKNEAGEPRPRCEHKWDGPQVALYGIDQDAKVYEAGFSATCSTCEMTAEGHGMRLNEEGEW